MTHCALVAVAILLVGCHPAADSNTAERTIAIAKSGAARGNLYQCEGCEGIFEAKAATLTNNAQIGPGLDQGEPMTIAGQVLRPDRRTPAAGVVIYAYQTNASGLYANGGPQTIWSHRHGRLRGWVKTGIDGRYQFDTIKPAPYPNDNIPAHIHLTVLEPGKRPYWIDDIVFDGEFGVTNAYRKSVTNQGGNGIVRATLRPDQRWYARRDIVLERHPNEVVDP